MVRILKMLDQLNKRDFLILFIKKNNTGLMQRIEYLDQAKRYE